MNPQRILLIGGTGFLGSHLAPRLSRAGHILSLPTRRRERAKHLVTLPTSSVIQADVHEPRQLAALMADQDIVINLVGILKGGKGQPYGEGFARAHVQLPGLIAAAARTAGVRRVLHVSAVKASADAPSGYLRSKAAGEEMLRAGGLDLTIFRPSVVFGSGDQFLNVFAALLATVPFMPLACPNALFQPIWVEDVCACIAASLSEPDSIGKIYELCGPRQYTLRELVTYAGAVTGRQRPIFGLSDTLSYLQAWAMEFVPGGPLTRDNYYSMQVPSVCADSCGLPFGLIATPLEAVGPSYLLSHTRKSRYNDFRLTSGR